MNKSPIRVGLIGAGYAARGFAYQCTHTKGMSLVAVANRTVEKAKKMLREVGNSDADFTDDPLTVINSKQIDIVI